MPSTSATDVEPSRMHAWAISVPTGPPPRTSRRLGTSVIAVTSRFVQMPSSSRRPSIGGITGSEPVATTMCSQECSAPSTATRPGPVIVPSPRRMFMPFERGHSSFAESSQLEVMKVRHSKADPASMSPPTASRAPGASRAAWSASPGRRSVFDGMQAQ
jgi:hypothetical protein